MDQGDNLDRPCIHVILRNAPHAASIHTVASDDLTLSYFIDCGAILHLLMLLAEITVLGDHDHPS